MIKIVKGDLLQATENIIAHQVNAQGVMGSGVAKAIRDKYPSVYNDYINLVHEHLKSGDIRENLLGEVQGVYLGNHKWVANLFGQLDYGYDGKQYTNTNSLYKSFKTLRNMAEIHNLSVALPYMIGAFRGGADWKEVENLILTAFDGYEVTLYKLHEG